MMRTDNHNDELPLALEPSAIKVKFNITDEELKILREFGEQYQSELQPFIEDFYRWMETQEEFQQFLANPSTLNRVKNQQVLYWREFFQANITSTYIKNRIHVGAVHAQIGLPIYSYSAAMNFSAEWWKNKIDTSLNHGAIKNFDVSVSKIFYKLIYLDTTIVTEVYHQQTQKKLKKTLDETQKIVHDVTTIAETVVKGDYSTKLEGDSVLNNAINKMIDGLNLSAIESKRDTWIKTGQAQLSEKLRGDQDLLSLSANIIAFLSHYFKAKVGVFYLINENKKLILTGSYAYQHRKNLSNEFEIGQGLLGQAVLEKQMMIVDNLPDDYLSVSSGLGESKSESILVCPILLEGKVTAVMEFGTFGKFDDINIELLRVSNDTIASLIESARNRERMNLLLEDSQKKSKELEAQSIALEQTNHDLEDQARRIKASEEELKTQSEELQATNEELEEKTQALEEQKRAIEKQNENLEKSQKLLQDKAHELQNSSKYKSEFLSNMSHELRTPLNSLLILSESLMENDDGNLNAEQIETAGIIHNSGKDLLNLINDILDLSKVEAGKLRIEVTEFNPSELASDLCMQLKPLIQKKEVKLTLNTEKNAPVLMKSDTMRVQQILKNLLSNAVKFTEKGGNVTLTIRLCPAEESYVQDTLQNVSVIAFEVKDTGIGISEEDQSGIFEAFQQGDGTTSRKYGGTGLGLTISRQLAMLLGGEIHVESKLGEGSTFTLFLPINNSVINVEKKTSNERIEIKTKLSSKKQIANDPLILIIEDDKNFNTILIKHLKSRKLEYICAETGKEGLEKAINRQPSAIILDVGFPDMSGLDLLDILKRDPKTKHIPIHVVSCADLKEESLQKGALGFINKPVDKQKLSVLLDNASKIIQQPIQNVLIVEDDNIQRRSICGIIQNENIKIFEAKTGAEAEAILKKTRIHCMVLDLKLPDMNGNTLLQKISKNKKIILPPVIIHTAKDITEEEEQALSEYAPSIVLKSADAPQRLVDEVTLFLNSLDENTNQFLNEVQKNKIQLINNENIKGKRILLVDDDMRNNIALGSYLRKHGFEIVTADNGELALKRLSEEATIDLILMDIMMPVMDGYTTMKHIRENEEYRSLPIIALTAKAMTEDREKCLQSGANDYLTKPIDMDKLFNVMRVWLNK